MTRGNNDYLVPGMVYNTFIWIFVKEEIDGVKYFKPIKGKSCRILQLNILKIKKCHN